MFVRPVPLAAKPLLLGLVLPFLTIACGKSASAPGGATAPSPDRPGGAPGTGGQPSAPDGGEPGGPDGDAAAAMPTTTADAAPEARPADPLNLRACGLLQMGSFVPITGQDTFSLGAPAIGADQKVYRIGIAKRQTGHVSFTVPAAGVYVIYTSTPAPLAVFALDGELVEVTNLRMSIPECPEVKGRHTLTLKMDRQIIRLGPEPAGSVDVIIQPAGPSSF
jgi:hypothetical protein